MPASVSVVEQLDIQGAQKTVGLEEALDRVPGVLVQSSQDFAQDVRIQIRGFGTRSAFGIREIKVLLDGLPLTDPDGQTQLDDLDLGGIQRIEVLRGPAGALYGNASGGVIQFFTEDAPAVPTAQAIVTGGSYGFGKYQLKGGGRTDKAQVFLDGSFLQLGGYRDHSATQAGNFTGKLRYDLTDDTDVMMLVTAVDSPLAQDPGALTRDRRRTTIRAAPATQRPARCRRSRCSRCASAPSCITAASGAISAPTRTTRTATSTPTSRSCRRSATASSPFSATLPAPARAGRTISRCSAGGDVQCRRRLPVSGRRPPPVPEQRAASAACSVCIRTSIVTGVGPVRARSR